MGGYHPLLIAKIFFENLSQNLSPRYLFVSGDANLRHATHAAGQLGWLEIMAVVMIPLLAAKKNLVSDKHEKGLILLLAGLYLAGIVPAALTWESNPHALRSVGAYPIAALLAGFVLFKAIKWQSWILPTTAAVAVFFSSYYFWDFFTQYPARSAEWFDVKIVEASKNLPITNAPNDLFTRTIQANYPDYEDLGLTYYHLSKGTVSCK